MEVPLLTREMILQYLLLMSRRNNSCCCGGQQVEWKGQPGRKTWKDQPGWKILEGVMQTVTVSRILLCSTHIVQDTTPPPSDEDTTPLPDNAPLSPCCDLDVSLTTSALLENLEADKDPFNILDFGTAINDPVEPSLTIPSPAASSPKVVGSTRRRRKTRQQHVRGWRTICTRDTRVYW